MKNFEVGKDGKCVVVALRRISNVTFEWHKRSKQIISSMLAYMLSDSFECVKLFEAARLHVESVQNETRIVENHHNERRRESESVYDRIFGPLVCSRFWRERAENVATAVDG